MTQLTQEGKIRICRNHLQLAIERIDTRYFNAKVDGPYSDEEDTKTQGIERSLQLELYHQWRRIIDFFPEVYTGLLLQGEIGKFSIPTEDGMKRKYFFPDLVLHGGQSGANFMNKNICYCELKVNKFETNDVDKIIWAVDRLSYSFGVYIVFNESRRNIAEFINDQVIGKSEIDKKITQKIFVSGSNGALDSVYNLMKSKH